MTDIDLRQIAAKPMLCSLDSNILLYTLDEDAPTKKKTAIHLLRIARFYKWPLAGQVVGEVFRRVQGRGWLWTHHQARQWVDLQLKHQTLMPASADSYLSALKVSGETNRQFWDCLIIASCAAHGVRRLYTEDTGSEPHTVMGVSLVNPFLMDHWDDAFYEN
jgi:predicted nucleic acid-binding protein